MLREKKLDTKDYISYDSAYIKIQNRQMHKDRKQISGCQGLQEVEDGE